MELFSYLLGKKAGGGGSSDLKVEFINPIVDGTNFYKNITKVPAVTFNGTSCLNMFSGFNNLTSIDFSNFDTSNVTTYKNMFLNCTGLTELDLSNFGESYIEDFSGMFNGCTNLKKINLSNLKTTATLTQNANVTNVFKDCSSLEELDMRNFNFTYWNNTQRIDYFFAYSGLKNVLIIVKDNEQKNYIVTNASVGLENVKTVAELNE